MSKLDFVIAFILYANIPCILWYDDTTTSILYIVLLYCMVWTENIKINLITNRRLKSWICAHKKQLPASLFIFRTHYRKLCYFSNTKLLYWTYPQINAKAFMLPIILSAIFCVYFKNVQLNTYQFRFLVSVYTFIPNLMRKMLFSRNLQWNCFWLNVYVSKIDTLWCDK